MDYLDLSSERARNHFEQWASVCSNTKGALATSKKQNTISTDSVLTIMSSVFYNYIYHECCNTEMAIILLL